MDDTTQMENTPNEPVDGKSVKPELSSPTTPNKKAPSRIQLLEAIAARIANFSFTTLKIFSFMLLLLSTIFIFINIYNQPGGIVVLPFEASNNGNISDIAIADLLTAELNRIQQIHAVKPEDLTLRMNNSSYTLGFPTEQSLGSDEMVVPKAETIEYGIGEIGNVAVGTNSLSLGPLIVAFKDIWPFSKPIETIRGSLQKYGSTIVLVTLLEGKNVKSWSVSRPLGKNNEEQIREMIKDMAFVIAQELQQSKISAKTWEGLENYTDALDAYNQYRLSRNPNFLALAGNYSLEAIKSEKGYEDPYDLLSLLEISYIMIERRNYASELCDKTVELDPTSPYAWNNKAATLFSLEKYNESVQAYDEAIKLDPKFTMAWNFKAATLFNMGKYNESIQACEKAIELDPTYADAWYNKGFPFFAQGKYNESIQAYDKAIELDPNNADAWYYKGNSLYMLNRTEEAIQAYNQAIEINPQFSFAWLNKGNAFSTQGKYNESIQAYDKAIELDPNYASAWYNKGNSLYRLNRTEEAIQAYNRSIEIYPQYKKAQGKRYSLLYGSYGLHLCHHEQKNETS
jgi:tetratricopeptide (TPR) repeat protein